MQEGSGKANDTLLLLSQLRVLLTSQIRSHIECLVTNNITYFYIAW